MGENKLCIHAEWRSGWRDGLTCKNKAKYGDYCGVHSPEKQKERAAKRGPSIWEIEYKRRNQEQERVKSLESSHAELLGALEELVEERTQDVSLLPFARIDQIKELIKRAEEK